MGTAKLIIVILAFSMASVSPSAALTADQPHGSEGIPIDLDVWIDGQYSSRTVVGGVPVSGSINNVYIDILAAYVFSDLVVAVHIVPLTGGSHTIGVGWNDQNGGLIISGPVGQSVYATFKWPNALGGFLFQGSCSRQFHLELDPGVNLNSVTPMISGILYSRGQTFSVADDIFIRGVSPTDLYGQEVLVDIDACAALNVRAQIPGSIQQADIHWGDDWHIHLDDAPALLAVRNENAWNWDGGYVVGSSQFVTGTISGTVYKYGSPHVIQGNFRGLNGATVMWDSTSPWLSLSVDLAFTGAHAAISVHDIGVHVERRSDGRHYFDNDWAFDNLLNYGECASAFYGVMEQCAGPGYA